MRTCVRVWSWCDDDDDDDDNDDDVDDDDDDDDDDDAGDGDANQFGRQRNHDTENDDEGNEVMILCWHHADAADVSNFMRVGSWPWVQMHMQV